MYSFRLSSLVSPGPGGLPEWSDCLSRPVNELIFPTLGVEEGGGGGGSVDNGDVAEKSDE